MFNRNDRKLDAYARQIKRAYMIFEDLMPKMMLITVDNHDGNVLRTFQSKRKKQILLEDFTRFNCKV